MSIKARATGNITTSREAFTTAEADDALARFTASLSEHLIIDRATVHPTGSPDVAVLSATVHAANLTETERALTDALRATGHPYDTERAVRLS